MTFKSNDTGIVRVTNKGILNAVSAGTTTVTVTITGGLSFDVTITVVE